MFVGWCFVLFFNLPRNEIFVLAESVFTYFKQPFSRLNFSQLVYLNVSANN